MKIKNIALISGACILGLILLIVINNAGALDGRIPTTGLYAYFNSSNNYTTVTGTSYTIWDDYGWISGTFHNTTLNGGNFLNVSPKTGTWRWFSGNNATSGYRSKYSFIGNLTFAGVTGYTWDTIIEPVNYSMNFNPLVGTSAANLVWINNTSLCLGIQPNNGLGYEHVALNCLNSSYPNHIIITVQNGSTSTIKAYVNGIPVLNYTLATYLKQVSYWTFGGQYATGYTMGFVGNVSYFRDWINYTVTDEDVTNIYNAELWRRGLPSDMPPVAEFSADVTYGVVPLPVQFTSHSTGTITEYDWDYGDSTTHGTTANPAHEYENSGTYTVSLTVTGPQGEDTETKTNYITVTTPTPTPTPSPTPTPNDFYGEPTIGAMPLDVQFTTNINLPSGSGSSPTYPTPTPVADAFVMKEPFDTINGWTIPASINISGGAITPNTTTSGMVIAYKELEDTLTSDREARFDAKIMTPATVAELNNSTLYVGYAGALDDPSTWELVGFNGTNGFVSYSGKTGNYDTLDLESNWFKANWQYEAQIVHDGNYTTFSLGYDTTINGGITWTNWVRVYNNQNRTVESNMNYMIAVWANPQTGFGSVRQIATMNYWDGYQDTTYNGIMNIIASPTNTWDENENYMTSDLCFVQVPAIYNRNTTTRAMIYGHSSGGDMYQIKYSIPANAMRDNMTSYHYIVSAPMAHGTLWGNDVAIADVENLKLYLASKFNTYSKSFFWGSSHGGTMVLNYGREHNVEMAAIALSGPVCHLWDFYLSINNTTAAGYAVLPLSYGVTNEQYNTTEQYIRDPCLYQEAFTNVPIMDWHGGEDNYIGWMESVVFCTLVNQSGGNAVLHIVPGAVHGALATQPIDIKYFFDSVDVQNTDNETESNVSVTGYHWNFGDGEGSTNQNPLHTYNNIGTYTVTLIATLDNGSTLTYTKTDYITVIAAITPTADFIGNPTSGIEPLTVTFTDQSTNTTGWTWSFGDGQTSTDQSPTHEYATYGTYTVSLTASNENGTNTKTRSLYITVTMLPPTLTDFTGEPLTGNSPLQVSFSCISTGITQNILWEYGDGHMDPGGVHTYTEPGIYNVRLTISNSGGSDTMTKMQYVNVTVPYTILQKISNDTPRYGHISEQSYTDLINSTMGNNEDWDSFDIGGIMAAVMSPGANNLGPYFWILVLGAIGLFIYIKTDSILIPGALYLLGGAWIGPLLLPEFTGVIWGLVIVGFAGLGYVLFRSR